MIKLVKESLNEKKEDKMDKSAGLVIIHENKILLAHPTGSGWKKTYSIPKGHVEDSETDIEAAIRETNEEIGLSITSSELSEEKGTIEYSDKSGKVYKKVVYFVVYLDKKPKLEKSNLQKDEIDHAKFFDEDEAKDVIFWRFKPLLKYINKKS